MYVCIENDLINKVVAVGLSAHDTNQRCFFSLCFFFFIFLCYNKKILCFERNTKSKRTDAKKRHKKRIGEESFSINMETTTDKPSLKLFRFIVEGFFFVYVDVILARALTK